MSYVYKTGTVTVTNGDTEVVGVGTAWTLSAVQGGMLVKDGYSAIVESVEDDTHLILANSWDKSTSSGVYAISYVGADAMSVVDLYQKMTNALRTLSLAGIHPDNIGTTAERTAYGGTLGAEDKKVFLHAVVGDDLVYYIWNGPESTSWIGPYPVAIPPDDPVDGIISSNESVTDIIQIDQPTYDALSPPNATTLYIII